jgi:[acyl-carrier-protein] S-malonyltransferase
VSSEHPHPHPHSHSHSRSSASPVLGLLDGRPLPRTELDRRLAALRGGPRASALPAPGSAEDRQLTRWVAQVLLTEKLCAAEAAARGLDATADPPVSLDQRAAVELGSIAAAAFEGSAAVRAVFAAVTADVTVTPDEIASYRAAVTDSKPASTVWRLATPDGEFEADPDTLPSGLAAALRAAPPGRQVTVGTWTAALVERRQPTDEGDDDPAGWLLECARRIAFVRWLDHTRAERLTLVPGLEHPGDPAQPDNHHRH